MQDPRSDRVRYPLRVKLALAAASLGFLLELATFALFMMPMIPLVPVFIVTMLGNGFMLASLLEWAASQRLAPKLRVPSAEPETRARPRGTQAAHAS
jgi:uncharacterized membrane protein YcfT